MCWFIQWDIIELCVCVRVYCLLFWYDAPKMCARARIHLEYLLWVGFACRCRPQIYFGKKRRIFWIGFYLCAKNDWINYRIDTQNAYITRNMEIWPWNEPGANGFDNEYLRPKKKTSTHSDPNEWNRVLCNIQTYPTYVIHTHTPPCRAHNILYLN